MTFSFFSSLLTIQSTLYVSARLNMNGRKRNDYPFQVHLIIGVLSLLFLFLCLLDDCLHSHYLV